MSSPFENPAIRYGMGFSSAVLLGVVAFVFFEEGLTRWLVLGLAVIEITVVPRILKMTVENNTDGV
ncbi:MULTISPECIES: hypothetical protein [unclassified Natrinema]|uniref:hypothetical protein n=1 Tax=unclassified Natrinema TaxID=2622230 RepID=UPI00026D51A2|nr:MULTISPECIES: hypothetical protein [unclassified Natrinema]AFO56016.1 hypothetical protein NJ7G_0769 [Natrinema sp. J7-2]